MADHVYQTDPHLTCRETAEYTGIKEQTLAVWRCQSRHLPFYKIGSRVFYKLSDIDSWLESRKVVPAGQAGKEA